MQLDVFERNNAKRFNVKYQQLFFNKKKKNKCINAEGIFCC
jgi:hypothetical protein